MEEQRIGVMYVNLFKRWVGGMWESMFPRGLRRSAALPFIVITLLICIPLGGWVLHRRGKFSTLKREIKGETPSGPPAGPLPGGMEPIVLSRNQTPGSEMPEFRSMTLLPGVGLDVLQITAFLPKQGLTPLLAGPKLTDFENGSEIPRDGVTDRWGVIEVPWAGMLTGLLAPVGTTFRTTFRGNTLEAPVDVQGKGTANGGLLHLLGADSTQLTPVPLGAGVIATFKNTDFDTHWNSKNDLTVRAEMSARSIELTVSATNVGEAAEPMGIGWHPRFLIPSHNRDAVQIRLPGGEQLEILDRNRGIPSGHFVPAPAGIARFQNRPATLGAEAIDANLAHLKPGLLDTESAVELRDPDSEIGLRLTAMSASIRSMQATSPAGASYVSLGAQTNYEDPLGKEWNGAENAAIATLMPGQTIEWKVRLELFSTSRPDAAGRH